MLIAYRGKFRYAVGIALFLVQDASPWTYLTPYRPRGVIMSGNYHERGFMNEQQPRDHRTSSTASRIDDQEHFPSSSPSSPSSKRSSNGNPLTTRADWLHAGAGLAAIVPAVALSTREAAMAAPKAGAVTVLGAGGKTGRECVEYLTERGTEVRAVARSLTDKEGNLLSFSTDKGIIALETADVTVPSSLPRVIEGSSAVIFASSASKQGGSARAVDFEGVVNVARACLSAKVPRLVVVSSGGVATPDSAVYKFLNLFGEIMTWKIRGEDELRSMYAAQGPGAACHYTIVRPGASDLSCIIRRLRRVEGLTLDPPRGVAAIELNQGDTKSGRIARSDVARVCAEAIYSANAQDCTLECYYKDTAKPLEVVGMSNILKLQTMKEEIIAFGTESTGDTWDAIFSGLKRDA